MSIVENFNEAMTLWFDLTGMDPNATKWRGIREISLHGVNERLKKSMELDDSLISTYLLLDAYSTEYFKEAKVSVHEFDDDPDKVFDYMDKVRKFRALIRSPEIVSIAADFTDKIRQALVKYGVEAQVINDFLDKKEMIAFIRRDALQSADRLRRNQFLQGESDPDEIKPTYNPMVFGYWNINSLIEHACGMPSGVSLNLIRHPNELYSYFTFSIRNGGNLLILSDSENYAHPLARGMRRRADRDFDNRVDQNRFPYQLLNIAYDDKGNAYHDKWRESAEKGLVFHQATHFTLKPIAELPPGQIVWLTLMFDLIVEKFWKQPIEPVALSYTNEMIRLEDGNRMLASAAKSNLPVVGYQPLNLPRLTVDDVRTEAMTPAVVGEPYGTIGKHFGRNKWMEDRYGDKVPEEALNLLGVDLGEKHEQALFLEGGEKKRDTTWRRDAERLPVPYQGSEHVKSAKPDHWGKVATLSERTYFLSKVDGERFGTREELDADRKFIARANFARGIQREADEEFEQEKAGILRWFKDRVLANIDQVLSFAAMEGETMERIYFESSMPTIGGEEPKERFRYTFAGLRPRKGASEYGPFSMFFAQLNLHNPDDHPRAREWTCFLNGTGWSWELCFRPQKIEDLAILTGVPVEELPFLLQNWSKQDPYVGNPILDRIDPLEWKLENPWNKLDFTVRIYLSKRAVNKIKKEQTCPDVAETFEGAYFKTTIRTGGHGNRSQVHHSNFDPDLP